MARAGANSLSTITNLEKTAAFLKFRVVPGSWWKGRATLKTVERNLYTGFLDHWSAHTFFVHRGLKLVQLLTTAGKHERFIEDFGDFGDDIRVTPGFWILFTSIQLFLGAHAKSVSGLASYLGNMSWKNTTRSPEAVWRGHCWVRLDFRRSHVSFLPEKRLSSGEERGLLSRTAAGNRA